MSEALQQAAGKRLRRVLAALTRTPLTGALAGMVVTAVVQSSSATTVMVIGFVSAGLLELPQAVAVIFGANIGTTVTAQLLAFRVEEMLGLVLFGGFFLCAVARTKRGRQMGTAVFSFGLLFAGMEQIQSVVEPLALRPEFEAWMAQVREKPLWGLLLGLGMTLVVQSSSATIGVLQGVAQQAGPDGVHSLLGLAGAVPVLLGDNVGTTITAILAAAGGTRALEEINKQIWILHFMDPIEAWSNLRRTDGMPTAYCKWYNRYPSENQSNGQRPLRLTYPIEEQSKNAANWQEAVDRMGGSDDWTVPVWWDVQ